MTRIDISETILQSSFPGVSNKDKQTFSFDVPAFTGSNTTLGAASTTDSQIADLGDASDFIQVQATFSPLISDYVVCDTAPSIINTSLGGFDSSFNPRFYVSSRKLRVNYNWFTLSPGDQTTPALSVTVIVYFYVPLF